MCAWIASQANTLRSSICVNKEGIQGLFDINDEVNGNGIAVSQNKERASMTAPASTSSSRPQTSYTPEKQYSGHQTSRPPTYSVTRPISVGTPVRYTPSSTGRSKRTPARSRSSVYRTSGTGEPAFGEGSTLVDMNTTPSTSRNKRNRVNTGLESHTFDVHLHNDRCTPEIDMYETAREEKEKLLQRIDRYLKLKTQRDARKKRMLCEAWNENVYDYIQKQLRKGVESEAFSRAHSDKVHLFERYLRTSNQYHGNVFLDIPNADYDPFKDQHNACYFYRLEGKADPLLRSFAKQEEERRLMNAPSDYIAPHPRAQSVGAREDAALSLRLGEMNDPRAPRSSEWSAVLALRDGPPCVGRRHGRQADHLLNSSALTTCDALPPLPTTSRATRRHYREQMTDHVELQ